MIGFYFLVQPVRRKCCRNHCLIYVMGHDGYWVLDLFCFPMVNTQQKETASFCYLFLSVHLILIQRDAWSMLESSKVCFTIDLPKELSHLSERILSENSPKFPTKFCGVLLLGFF